MDKVSGRRMYRFMAGNALMSWCAGFVNALTVLMLSTTSSHVTGLVTRIGFATARAEWTALSVAFVVWLAYMLGGVVGAGVLGPGSKLSLHRHRYAYTACFIVEIACLLLARYAFGDAPWRRTAVEAALHADFAPKFFVTFAMGLHNSMTTVYSGGPGRSGHFTGYTTDISIILGFSLRARRKDQANWWRMRFFPTSLLLFVLGALCGGATSIHYGGDSILVPVVFDILAIGFCLAHGHMARLTLISRYWLDDNEIEEWSLKGLPQPVTIVNPTSLSLSIPSTTVSSDKTRIDATSSPSPSPSPPPAAAESTPHSKPDDVTATRSKRPRTSSRRHHALDDDAAAASADDHGHDSRRRRYDSLGGNGARTPRDSEQIEHHSSHHSQHHSPHHGEHVEHHSSHHSQHHSPHHSHSDHHHHHRGGHSHRHLQRSFSRYKSIGFAEQFRHNKHDEKEFAKPRNEEANF